MDGLARNLSLHMLDDRAFLVCGSVSVGWARAVDESEGRARARRVRRRQPPYEDCVETIPRRASRMT